MAIKIFNTLSGKKAIFRPIKKGKVGIYVCGPTVYDDPHIGHLRSAFVFEVIRRYFAYSGYKVKFVKNITDVDDKIIDKAVEEIKIRNPKSLPCRQAGEIRNLKEKVKEVAEKYLDRYHQAMETFGISPADIEPKATEHIPEMLKLVEGLIKKDFAYQKEGDVYFRVRKFSRYGKLSRQSIDDLISGMRIESGEGKLDPLDFALWKGAKENEPFWKTAWGQGRPGWHIECSAMSMKYLGKNFDIHGGGKDLIFPHHENEIAQTESFTEKTFANYWIHNGLLTINGQKMSKSLGNFISLDDILTKYHPEVLKLFFLSAHYSHPIDFTYEKMEEARRARERFYILLKKIGDLETNPPRQSEAGRGNQKPVTSKRSRLFSSFNKFRKEFIEAMDDDFNTPQALAVLFDLVNFANKNFTNTRIIREVKFLLLDLGKNFCLFEKKTTSSKLPIGLDENEISKLIEKRNELRKTKNFADADKIREDLEKNGIIIEDGKGQTTWRYRY